MNYRKPLEQDRALLETWIAADSDHRDKCKADFWMFPSNGAEVFVAEDEDGPVLFVRAENSMRVHMEFAPGHRIRTARALIEGFEWLRGSAKQRGYREMIFDSVSSSLVRFCQRIGFKPSANDYKVDL